MSTVHNDDSLRATGLAWWSHAGVINLIFVDGIVTQDQADALSQLITSSAELSEVLRFLDACMVNVALARRITGYTEYPGALTITDAYEEAVDYLGSLGPAGLIVEDTDG